MQRSDLGNEQRELWNFVALALAPLKISARLSKNEAERALLRPKGNIAMALYERSPERDELDRFRVAILASAHKFNDNDWYRSDSIGSIVTAAIRRLSASKNISAGDILRPLASEVRPSLRPALAHAATELARMIRDELYVSPPISSLAAALAGGPPASPADLAAAVLEEVARYKETLRTGSETPWKRYWNTDGNGTDTTPQVENEDRDRLVEPLRVRFERYGIMASLPEARRSENTRADILLVSHSGTNLLIEIKRHYNRELWSAPLQQLAGYAANAGASGFGIYPVLWFGTEFPLAVRASKETLPSSAETLEVMLQEDIPPNMQDKLAVVVLDVSRPATQIMSSKSNQN